MKLGLGRLRDVLKTGSGTATAEGETEQAENKDKAEKEEMQTIKSEENKLEISEGKEGNTMELKKTGLEEKKGPLSPADHTKAEKTGLIFFPAFDWAISPTHPEREERLLYTRDQIFEEGLMDLPEIAEYKPRLAEYRDIARVHFCVPDIKAQATTPHLIAAGSCLVLGDALMKAEVKNAFALIRPPGHHVYQNSGNYTARLTVSNDNGTDSKTQDIVVTKFTILPVADFSANVTSGYAPLSVLFTDKSQNATSCLIFFKKDK